MDEYIKREYVDANVDEALRLLDADNANGDLDYSIYCELHDAICMIGDAPDADVVEIVHCEHCIHWADNGTATASCDCDALIRRYDFFCANGRRREDGEK